jgi:hypothetical protein
MVGRFRLAHNIELLHSQREPTTDGIEGPQHAVQSWAQNFLEFAALLRKAYFLRTDTLTTATAVREARDSEVPSWIYIEFFRSSQKITMLHRMMWVLLPLLLSLLPLPWH